MRRAEIPFAVSQGFHPQPRMVFALSLALGVLGFYRKSSSWSWDSGSDRGRRSPSPTERRRPGRARVLLDRSDRGQRRPRSPGRSTACLCPMTPWHAPRSWVRLSDEKPSPETTDPRRGASCTTILANASIDFWRRRASIAVRTASSRRGVSTSGPSFSELTLTDFLSLEHGSLDHSDGRCPAGGDRGRSRAPSASRSGGSPGAYAPWNCSDEVPEHRTLRSGPRRRGLGRFRDAAGPEPSSETPTDGQAVADERPRSSAPHPLLDSPLSFDS